MIEQRAEFVALARLPDSNVSELCRRFGISRKTGYKWLARDEPQEQSRRPLTTPTRTTSEIEVKVVSVRTAHPAWGGRKIAHVLKRDDSIELAPSTVTSVLRRHGLITSEASAASKAWERFEHAQPNDLWQIDFKGHVAFAQGRLHPLTVIDDHSRYNVVLDALNGQTCGLVQPALRRAFERHGLPQRINSDNGPPWGSGGGGITQLGVWLVRLGISVSRSRPLHPQTNGKDERFHRTLLAELLRGQHFADLEAAQAAMNAWRAVYNTKRPHEALGMLTPIERYRVSHRAMPRSLPPIEYGANDIVRNVQACGIVKFKRRRLRTSYALHGYPVALRPVVDRDGVYDVFFCHQRVDRFDLNQVKSTST